MPIPGEKKDLLSRDRTSLTTYFSTDDLAGHVYEVENGNTEIKSGHNCCVQDSVKKRDGTVFYRVNM